MGSGVSRKKKIINSKKQSTERLHERPQSRVSTKNTKLVDDPEHREAEHPRNKSDKIDTLVNSRNGSQPGSRPVPIEIADGDNDSDVVALNSENQNATELPISDSQVEFEARNSLRNSVEENSTPNNENKTSDTSGQTPVPLIFNSNFNQLVAAGTSGEPTDKPDIEKVATTTSIKMTEQDNRRSCARTDSMHAKDIMISYSHKDMDKMRKCKDALEAAGISVWVDMEGLSAGSDFLNKIGQAIVDAKLFMQILSINSAVSRYCKDELALAYVSSKPMFPVAIEERDDVLPHLDFGQKLQLAPVQWTMITKESEFDESFGAVIESMKVTLSKLDNIEGDNKTREEAKESPKKDAGRPGMTGAKKTQRTYLNRPKESTSPGKEKKGKTKDFWEKHFHKEAMVTWAKFREEFCKEYSDQLNALYGAENIDWLISVIHREMDEDEDEIINKFNYDEFCFLDEEKCDFWTCVQQQALESYTMRLVFNMDSTVRIDAIQNLGKFNSPTVLEALLDLCKDKDPNVRAVAAISLARVGSSGNKRVINSLLKLLRDKDRLVRESGCLCLGYIKAKQAVGSIVHLWRNDPISNVREAAQVALEKIGGDEAQKAMHITRVLSTEIKALAEKS